MEKYSKTAPKSREDRLESDAAGNVWPETLGFFAKYHKEWLIGIFLTYQNVSGKKVMIYFSTYIFDDLKYSY